MTENSAVQVSESLQLARGEPSFADMMLLADTLLKTGFLPQAIKTAGQALAIILTGKEMGLGPMQSLRSIGVINGRPVLAADLQLALFHRAGGMSKWVTLTETDAKLWLKHPNGVEHTETFSMDDALRAKLTDRGDTYQKYPKAMLRSRAITAGLKSVGFEPVTGVYDPDELGAIVPNAEDWSKIPAALAEKDPMPWDNNGAPTATPTITEKPRGPVMPFGDKKGTPLAEIDSATLVTARAWCIKKDPQKFAKLIEQVDEVLAARQGE